LGSPALFSLVWSYLASPTDIRKLSHPHRYIPFIAPG